MADFITTSTSKTATRDLRDPIQNLTTFQNIIAAIIANNPWNCTAYQSKGQAQPPISISKEYYTGKVQYEDSDGKVIGTITIKAPTQAGFTESLSVVAADTDLEDAIGGIATRDPMGDRYSCTLRCHASYGDLYYVTFSRDKVRVTSYEQDSVLSDLETWADSISALA